VGISGGTAIVGAYKEHADGVADSGSAYIFERGAGVNGTWPQTETKKLKASSPAADDRFGTAVAISGDYAVVGAPLRNESTDDEGAAYIFERTAGEWTATETKKITANVRVADDYFGPCVAIDGDTIVVGAPRSDPNGSLSGSAYIFVRGAVTAGEWTATETQKITASDGVAGAYFGGDFNRMPNGVSIYGDTIMVGAHGDGVSGAGSAYIFVRNSNGTWSATETQKIVANTPIANDNFGVSVAVGQYGAFVGAGHIPQSSNTAGTAYIITPANILEPVGLYTHPPTLSVNYQLNSDNQSHFTREQV
jgi:hypothetical protein